MKTKNILTKITLLTLSILSYTASAEPYKTADGFDKIKTNVENSKLNKVEYDKNLNTVNGNIAEINKVKTTVVKQKESVSSEIVQNNESLKKVILQEREINQLITAEKEKLAIETKQLEQLEKLTAQIKQNQEQRNALIADYQSQLTINQDEKKAWKSRESELRAQESKTIQALRGLASDETNWKNKQKGYEIEVKRWSAESEKQQKIFDTYQGLKEAQ
jgi:chromosome segregation ATPase